MIGQNGDYVILPLSLCEFPALRYIMVMQTIDILKNVLLLFVFLYFGNNEYS